jgi:hypothetical protein
VPYPNGYLYLTAHWVNTETTAEAGQFGLKFDTATPASQSLVNAAAGRLSTMWSAATTDIPSERRLIFARLAAVGANGLYVPGTIAYDFIYPGPVPGAGALAAGWPLQVAHVMSLHTAMPRGLAHAGRTYLPPIDEGLLSTGQWTSAQTSSRNNTFAAMLTGLNTDLGGKCTIFSKVGAGSKNQVTSVNSDTRPDVQRRRANQQVGVVGIAAVVT